MYKLSLWLRSLVFTCLMIIWTVTYSFICLLAFPFPLRFRNKLIGVWTKSIVHLLKIICKIDYKIEGLENIPANRNGVVLAKHQSTWETFFLQGFFHQPAIILKRELLWIPFFGWGLAIIDPIAINRNDTQSAMEQILRKGRKCLNAGRWVLVFPEGTRIAPGKKGKYRLGGARLAVDSNYPIIPIAHNAGHFWPRRGFIKYPGTIQLIIGPVIETDGRTAEDVLTEAKNWIENTMQRIEQ